MLILTDCCCWIWWLSWGLLVWCWELAVAFIWAADCVGFVGGWCWSYCLVLCVLLWAAVLGLVTVSPRLLILAAYCFLLLVPNWCLEADDGVLVLIWCIRFIDFVQLLYTCCLLLWIIEMLLIWGTVCCSWSTVCCPSWQLLLLVCWGHSDAEAAGILSCKLLFSFSFAL